AGVEPCERVCGHAPVGTPLYMAPEVWRGEAGTRRSDVCSLGCLHYELVSGRRAYVAESMEDLRVRVLAGPEPTLPPGPLADLVLRCLRRAPPPPPPARGAPAPPQGRPAPRGPRPPPPPPGPPA